jgi:hypothetical protein
MLRSFFSRIYASLVSQHMAPWLWVSVILTIAIAVFAPQQLRVTLYKLSLITTAAWVAYWIDRALFPYARPDRFVPPEPTSADTSSGSAPGLSITREQAIAFSSSQLRRALIISAAMIGVALGA